MQMATSRWRLNAVDVVVGKRVARQAYPDKVGVIVQVDESDVSYWSKVDVIWKDGSRQNTYVSHLVDFDAMKTYIDKVASVLAEARQDLDKLKATLEQAA